MFDYEYDKDDLVWNAKTSMWEATDGELFDGQHPRLIGLIVDNCLDLCGSGGTFKILHGHRYVKGHRYPDHLGVYVPSRTISELGIDERDRVVMEVIPSGDGALFTATYLNKLAI